MWRLANTKADSGRGRFDVRRVRMAERIRGVRWSLVFAGFSPRTCRFGLRRWVAEAVVFVDCGLARLHEDECRRRYSERVITASCPVCVCYGARNADEDYSVCFVW